MKWIKNFDLPTSLIGFLSLLGLSVNALLEKLVLRLVVKNQMIAIGNHT